METTKIAELAKILKDNGLTKLDLTEGDNRLVLEAVSAPVAPAVVMPAAVPVEAVPVAAAEAPAAAPEAPEAPAAPEEDLLESENTPGRYCLCSASGWCSTLCVRRGSCGSRRYCMYRRIHEDVQ